jgi:hypothetical protein
VALLKKSFVGLRSKILCQKTNYKYSVENSFSMPFAVTHVILTIIIIDIFRDYIAKKRFSMWFVLIGGVAGLLPDIDLPITWIWNFISNTSISFHRLYTHSILWPLILLIIGIIINSLNKAEYTIFKWDVPKHKIFLFFIMLSFGWFFHIFLDCMLAADGLLNFLPGIPLSFCPSAFSNESLMGLDAIILVLWLIHEQWKHEIKDYV